MARILIGEPSDDVRELLVHLLARLGHEPYVCDVRNGDVPMPDVLVFEPATDVYLELAASLRRRNPALPLVVCSIQPPSETTRALGPVRHLLKPFVRADLAEAIEQAARANDPR